MRKKFLALLLIICVTMSITPAMTALASTNWDLYDYKSSGFLKPDNHRYGTLLWFETNGNATHYEGVLNSYYAANGGFTTGMFYKDLSADLYEEYYWTPVSGMISMYSSKIGSISGTLSCNADDGAGGSASTKLSSGKNSVNFSIGPESYASFSLDASAIGFIDLNLTVTSYASLIKISSNRVYGALNGSRTYPLRALLNY